MINDDGDDANGCVNDYVGGYGNRYRRRFRFPAQTPQLNGKCRAL